MRILFDSKDKKFKTKFGTLRENEGCGFNIKIPCNIKTKFVTLIFTREDGGRFASYDMKKTSDDGVYETYSCEVCFARSALLFYYFRIETKNETFSLFKQGYSSTNMEEGECWQLTVIPADFEVSPCFHGKVMYQIFPDRFYKAGECDLTGKLTPYFVHQSFDEMPNHKPDEKGIVQNNDFFGGNLKGITEKLDYLCSLGVGIVYMNPIFKAYSNHRYDTADYMKLDEMLGTDEDFAELCSEAHKRGIKILLDGVFSHTGSDSVYFDSERRFGGGALSDPDSPYRKWYDFKKYPDEYVNWWGIKTLPCVNENDPDYREYIIGSDNSVVAKWIGLGADGFRLDVADELPDTFIAQLRARMKGLKKDSMLIGEVWEDASNKESYGVRRNYFTKSELDSVMNYPYRKAIIDFVLGEDTGEGFRDAVMTIAENYPKDVLDSLMNHLSTHDTVRIITKLGVTNPPKEKDERAKFRMSDEQRQIALQRLRVAAFLQYVLPGSPCIYYGDEIGTEGFEDPFCRTFFNWSLEGCELTEFYRELGRLKNNRSALQRGTVRINVPEEGVITVERLNGNESLLACVNVSDKPFCFEECGEELYSHETYCEGNKKFTNKFGFILYSRLTNG